MDRNNTYRKNTTNTYIKLRQKTQPVSTTKSTRRTNRKPMVEKTYGQFCFMYSMVEKGKSGVTFDNTSIFKKVNTVIRKTV